MIQPADHPAFAVPQSLWEGHQPATVYLLRVSPGHLEQIGSEDAEEFLAGSGSLHMPAGDVDLAVITLSIEERGGERGFQPRVVLCRRPVDGDGRLDRARLEEIRRRPAKERAEALGWWANEDERSALFRTFEDLAEGPGPDDLPLLEHLADVRRAPASTSSAL